MISHLRNCFSFAAIGFSLDNDFEWYLRIGAMLLAAIASYYSIRANYHVKHCKECPLRKSITKPNDELND